jgi:hypothetical protein
MPRPQSAILNRVLTLCAGLAFVQQSAGATHDFCVTRVEVGGPEYSRARLYFNGEDPGREAAGLMLIQHYRSKGTPAVRIDDESSGVCAHSDTQHIALGEPARQRPKTAGAGLPNLGRAANQATHALTGIAEDASRLMCRILPC